MGQKWSKIEIFCMKMKFTGQIALLTRIPKIYNFYASDEIISGEKRSGNLGKWSKTGESIIMQIREWPILIGNTGIYSLVSKSLQYFGFLHVRSHRLLKTEKDSFQSKFCPSFAALPSLKLGRFFKF